MDVDGVFEEVMGDGLEGTVFAFGCGENVVVRLALRVGGREGGAEVFAEKFDGDALVGAQFVETEPEQVRVIGHEHVGGAGDGVAGASVEQRELPRVMESGGEPAGGAVFERERPVDEGAATVAARG